MKESAADYNIIGEEHWVDKNGVKLFLWEKYVDNPDTKRGTVLFVHGSSMASQATFDLQVPGRPFSSVMDWFAALGFDTWCVDLEGYGRSDKDREINCDTANGASDLAVASAYIQSLRNNEKFLVYGIAGGALRAAMFAENHPDRISRLALDAFVWTGVGSPTLAERQKKLPQFMSSNRRAFDRDGVYTLLNRDQPGTADDIVIEALSKAVTELDDSMPNGTFIDMCSKLPLIKPEKILCPTIIMRGEFDGIAHIDDLIKFFAALPNNDKQFSVMAGVSHASFQQKNYLLVYTILYDFFSRPEPLYKIT